jgi:ubiquinone/menaquinone biosynthesis methyltransferase
VSLARAFDSPADKRRYVRRLFATIAGRYDLITRLLSFGLDRRWKARLVDATHVTAGARVLDLACGTGDIAALMAGRGATVTGLDITFDMLKLARAKPNGAGIRWIAGDMTALPLAAGSVDVITTGYGLRNVPDLPQALSEAHRVLADEGRLASLDFNRPESRAVRAVYLAYLTAVGSVLCWMLHRDPDTYRYIPASIARYPGARGVARLMEDAGFVDVLVLPVLGGLMAIHLAAKRPIAGSRNASKSVSLISAIGVPGAIGTSSTTTLCRLTATLDRPRTRGGRTLVSRTNSMKSSAEVSDAIRADPAGVWA